MAGVENGSDRRGRGNIRRRGGSLQVRVYSGVDPVTGKEIYLSETVPGTDKAAYRRADKVMTKLQSQVDKQRVPSTNVSFSYAIDEWLRSSDIEPTTRHAYVGYIERTIRPALGEMPVNKLSARNLETLYGELRRCRRRCDGLPYIEHKTGDEHDCKKSKCKPPRMPADGSGVGAADSRDHQWCAERRGAVGVDRLESRQGRTTSAPACSPAGSAVTG
ncbi:hypothetical protein GCM10009676_39850 [Prauserella halophila]|uniref:Integrase SAM-like N-terminal domain-containing protein n=1 Tax=Prauserella halophila TaxID=185641 RepID=A0ABN1WGC9_9PSEU|nr:N-terminal phage integrase SAM-like domain-containing protein [Prauserella halophila]